MKAARLTVLLVVLCASGIAAQEPKDTLPSAPEGKTWKMIWHDEFDGTKIDTSKWDIPEYKRRAA
jgi:hypothetical protein